MSTICYEISVLISTYNDRELVPKKLLEIQRQTAFARAEFIFIEPNSPERERELLEPFCEQHANSRLITLDKRVGLYEAWNIGWNASRAPLVCVSNMDDAMHPRLLERVLQEMPNTQADLFAVLIAKQTLDKELDSFAPQRLRTLDLSMRPGPFFVWSRQLKDHFGMFDERFEIAGDKDFWSRAAHHHLHIGFLPEILYLYTKHLDQLSKSAQFKSRRAADVRLAETKAYPHRWPAALQRKIKRIRTMRRMLWLGAYWSNRLYVEPNN